MSVLEEGVRTRVMRRTAQSSINDIQYQFPSRKLGDGDVIERGRQQQWQRRGGVHPKLEESPESWRRQRKCLDPPLLRVAVSMRLWEKKKKSRLTMTPTGRTWFWRRELRPLLRWSIHHQHEALFGGRELRDVMVRMRTSDVLLHGAIAFLLLGGRILACRI